MLVVKLTTFHRFSLVLQKIKKKRVYKLALWSHLYRGNLLSNENCEWFADRSIELEKAQYSRFGRWEKEKLKIRNNPTNSVEELFAFILFFYLRVKMLFY